MECSSLCPHDVCMTGRTGGLKNLVTCDQAFEWVRPMKPSPIIATLISRIANLLDRSRNRKPSAEGDVAFTRSSGFAATIAGAQADPKGRVLSRRFTGSFTLGELTLEHRVSESSRQPAHWRPK